MRTGEAPVPDEGRASIERLVGLMVGAHVSIMILVGLRLGLYQALKTTGPATSDELAESHRIPRTVATRVAARDRPRLAWSDYRDDYRFELSPAATLLLADEGHVLFLGPSFYSLPLNMIGAQRLPEAFRTGLGLTWDDGGPEMANAYEQTLRNWYHQELVSTALPMLDGVVDKLRAGGRVADVGCGTGIALIEMAGAFPPSEFHGYEISEYALLRAEANRNEAGQSNVTFHDMALEPLPADDKLQTWSLRSTVSMT